VGITAVLFDKFLSQVKRSTKYTSHLVLFRVISWIAFIRGERKQKTWSRGLAQVSQFPLTANELQMQAHNTVRGDVSIPDHSKKWRLILLAGQLHKLAR